MSDTPTTGRLELSPRQLVASTLAAASAAVVGSSLGVNGTIAGAAVFSVIATVGSALYSHSIQRTSDRLRRRRAGEGSTALESATSQSATLASAGSGSRPSASAASEATGSQGAGRSRPVAPAGRIPRRVRWSAVAAASALVFGGAIAAVTTGELAAHRPLSSVVVGRHQTASTSIGSIFAGHRPKRDLPARPLPADSPAVVGPSAPGPFVPSPSAPASTPTPAATPVPVITPSPAPTPVPSP